MVLQLVPPKQEVREVHFAVGQNISARSLCDYDCLYTAKVISLSDKMVTVEFEDGKTKRCKIYKGYDGVDYCMPFGHYSMAPMFHAEPIK
jgi:hypothetical protein